MCGPKIHRFRAVRRARAQRRTEVSEKVYHPAGVTTYAVEDLRRAVAGTLLVLLVLLV